MGKNEKTSKKVAKVAGKVLRKRKATAKQAKTLAGSALTQAPDKRSMKSMGGKGRRGGRGRK